MAVGHSSLVCAHGRPQNQSHCVPLSFPCPPPFLLFPRCFLCACPRGPDSGGHSVPPPSVITLFLCPPGLSSLPLSFLLGVLSALSLSPRVSCPLDVGPFLLPPFLPISPPGPPAFGSPTPHPRPCPPQAHGAAGDKPHHLYQHQRREADVGAPAGLLPGTFPRRVAWGGRALAGL